jgi:hypothetical protein
VRDDEDVSLADAHALSARRRNKELNQLIAGNSLRQSVQGNDPNRRDSRSEFLGCWLLDLAFDSTLRLNFRW